MLLPVNYDQISQSQRKLVREEYVRLQNNKCCHCGNSLDRAPSKEVIGEWINTKLFPPNFFKWSVHLHHSHDTGMTIGAVHAYCNAVLWQYYGE
jgi:hypothetical protein